MNARRKTAFVLLSILVLPAPQACAPTLADLRKAVQEEPTADPFGVVRKECEDYGQEESCKIMFSDLCRDLNSRHLAAAEEAFQVRHFARVPAVALATEAECGVPDVHRNFSKLADDLERCDQSGAPDCEVETLLALQNGTSYPPAVEAYRVRRQPRLCAYILRSVYGDLTGNAPVSDVSRLVRPFLDSGRWCTEEQRTSVRKRLTDGLDSGVTTRGQTFGALSACREVQAAEQDADIALRCQRLVASMSRKLTAEAQTAAKENRFALSVILIDTARVLSVPLEVPETSATQWRKNLKEWSSWKVLLDLEADGKNQNVATIARTSAMGDSSFLPPAFVWSAVGEQTLAGEVRVAARFEGSFDLRRRETTRNGTSEYVSGYRTVDNPDYYANQQACVAARNDLANCLQISAREKAAAEQCAAAQAQAQRDYNSCLQQQRAENQRGVFGRFCMSQSPYCSTNYSTCTSYPAEAACQQAAGTPPTMQVPVESIYNYVIHIVHQSVSVPVVTTVRLPNGKVVTSRFQVAFSESDEYVNAEPSYNVYGDALSLTSEGAIEEHLARQVVAKLRESLVEAKKRLCDSLLVTQESVIRAGNIRDILNAYSIGRDASCSMTAEIETVAKGVLTDYLKRL